MSLGQELKYTLFCERRTCARPSTARRSLWPTIWIRIFLAAGCMYFATGTATTVVNLIGKLYHLEKQANEQKLNPGQIKNLRQERAKPIMDKIKAILDERVETTPPKSLLGKAVHLRSGPMGPADGLSGRRPFEAGQQSRRERHPSICRGPKELEIFRLSVLGQGKRDHILSD